MNQKSSQPNLNVIQELKRGKVYPIYLLYGEEGFLIDETLSEMLELLLPKPLRDFNFDILSGIEASAEEIISICETYPVMSERRLALVKDPLFFTSQKDTFELLKAFQAAKETYRAGNLSKAVNVFARILGLSPAEFVEQDEVSAEAIKIFFEENKDELSEEDIEILRSARSEASQLEFRSTSKFSTDSERLMSWLESGIPKTTVLIFTVSGSVDGRSKLFKMLGKVGKVVHFDPLRIQDRRATDQIYKMTLKRLQPSKKSIAQDAFQELLERTGGDLRQTFDELEKLITLIGERERIELEDVKSIVAQSQTDTVFDLTDSMAQRNASKALVCLKSSLSNGEHPIRIHAMLTRQVRFLLQAQFLIELGLLRTDLVRSGYEPFVKTFYSRISEELTSLLPDSRQHNLLKQKPYPLYLTLKQLGKFSADELIWAMEILLEADIQLKSSQLPPEVVLEMLVVDLCQGEGGRAEGGRRS